MRSNAIGKVENDGNGNSKDRLATSFHEIFFVLPDGMCAADLNQILRVWYNGRPYLLIVLCILPYYQYWHQLHVLKEAWFAPIMTLVACAIPASGAPVAGGVIFLPVLTMAGVCARDAVAFTAVAQVFGVGIFAPLNWMIRDPNLLNWRALQIATIPSVLGMFIALMVMPIHGLHGDHAIQLIFASFCVILFSYTLHGLVKQTIAFDKRPRDVKFACHQLVYYNLIIFLASWLTGYIGVTVDKIMFMLLTWSHGVNARDATITGTTLVGWLSAWAGILHMISPCDQDDPLYIGAVPYHVFLLGLPGLLLGSLMGPVMNTAIGTRNVMKIFLTIILFDLVHNFYDVYISWSDPRGEGSCQPQCPNFKEMQLFVFLQAK